MTCASSAGSLCPAAIGSAAGGSVGADGGAGGAEGTARSGSSWGCADAPAIGAAGAWAGGAEGAAAGGAAGAWTGGAEGAATGGAAGASAGGAEGTAAGGAAAGGAAGAFATPSPGGAGTSRAASTGPGPEDSWASAPLIHPNERAAGRAHKTVSSNTERRGFFTARPPRKRGRRAGRTDIRRFRRSRSIRQWAEDLLREST